MEFHGGQENLIIIPLKMAYLRILKLKMGTMEIGNMQHRSPRLDAQRCQRTLELKSHTCTMCHRKDVAHGSVERAGKRLKRWIRHLSDWGIKPWWCQYWLRLGFGRSLDPSKEVLRKLIPDGSEKRVTDRVNYKQRRYHVAGVPVVQL